MAGGMSGGYGSPNVPPIGGMPPPPMREARSGSNGCLIGGLVGCGVLIVLVVILGVVGMKAYKKSGAGISNYITSLQMTEKYARNLPPVSKALEEYKAAHSGKYPPTLAALVPKYLTDKSLITPRKEDNISFTYTVPKPDAKPDAIVVSISASETKLDFMTATSRQTLYMRLLKDGSIVQDQVQRVDVTQRYGAKKGE